MSSVAPPQDATAAVSNKKKNKKTKKPKKPIDTNSKDGDGSTADQQPSPSPRNTNNNHDLSAGDDDDEPSTPMVSTSMPEAAHLLLVVESTTGSGDPPLPCGHELPSCIHSGTVLDRTCIRTLFMKLFSAAIPELAQIAICVLGLAPT